MDTLLPLYNTAKIPHYLSNGTAWTVNDTGGIFGDLNNLFMTQEPSYGNLGYQAYNQSNLVTDPNSLGGLWFGRKGSKKARKGRKGRKGSKKTRKGRKGSKKARKSLKNSMGTVRTMGPRMMTPGSITTDNGWGFTL